MRARDIDFAEVDRDEQDLLLLDAGFGENLAAGAGDKALAPEFEAVPADRRLMADAVDRGNIATVGDGVAAVGRFPRAELGDALLGLFAAVPYCLDLIGGPYVETREAVVKTFRPKSAIRAPK